MSDTDEHTDAPSPAPAADAEPAAELAGSALHLRLAVGLAAVFALLAAVLAVVAVRSDPDPTDELRETAGRFAEALVSYDYHDPDAHRKAVLAFATGSFEEEYQAAFDRGLSQVITKVKAVSHGYVKDVYLATVDGGQAQAIVVVDIEHEGSGGSNTLYDVYFRVDFIELDGHWLVDNVTDLSFGTDGGAGSTTTTTASATTTVP